MADALPPPAQAGGIVVADDEPALTGDGVPLSPDSMVRSKDAIERASRNRDAEREAKPTKVRLVPSYMDDLDKLMKKMALPSRAAVIYRLVDEALNRPPLPMNERGVDPTAKRKR